jgi:hypothetical protein
MGLPAALEARERLRNTQKIHFCKHLMNYLQLMFHGVIKMCGTHDQLS